MAKSPRPTTRSLDSIVDEKMRILEEFHAVDRRNYDSVRADFVCQLNKLEYGDIEYAADRIARCYISERLARL